MPRRRRKIEILETEKKNRPALESGFMGNSVGNAMPDARGLWGTEGRTFFVGKGKHSLWGWKPQSRIKGRRHGQNREAEPNAGNTDQNREAESNAGDTDQNRKAEPNAGSTDRTELSDASSEEAKTLVVHICGAVSAPGVYELPAGSRIIDAVEAGGGFLPEADEACCNLAEEIVDGCQIYIMTKSESCADGQAEKKAGIQTSPDSDMQTTDINVRSNSTTALENGLVNLNTADVAALMTLPGIGESRAKAIISYREQQGAFTKIEDIMKISGIKQAAFSKIKDKITV